MDAWLKAVEHADVIAAREQIDGMRTDEPRAARDEC